jgi:hypothetical protein
VADDLQDSVLSYGLQDASSAQSRYFFYVHVVDSIIHFNENEFDKIYKAHSLCFTWQCYAMMMMMKALKHLSHTELAS